MQKKDKGDFYISTINIGDILDTKSCGKVKVLDKQKGSIVKILFKDTGYIRNVKMSNLKQGAVLDVMKRTVNGVGYLGEIPKGIIIRDEISYSKWACMLRRCYDFNVHENTKKAYDGVTVSEYFKCYNNFRQWYSKQHGKDFKDWHLDKDLLFEGSKEYHEDKCVLLPVRINNLIRPVGKLSPEVIPNGKFRVRVCGKNYGVRDTYEEAVADHEKYKKLELMKELEKYRDILDPRAVSKIEEICKYSSIFNNGELDVSTQP